MKSRIFLYCFTAYKSCRPKAPMHRIATIDLETYVNMQQFDWISFQTAAGFEYETVVELMNVYKDLTSDPIVHLSEWMKTPVQSFHATNPLIVCILLMLATSTYCFVMGFLTGNYSKVDQLWSILPVVYSIIFAASSRWNIRLTVMAVLATLWGLRLTYNFARKGGYNGKEDYRWLAIRYIINNRVFFEIFNLIFISLFQNILLLLIALPSWAAYLNQEMPLNLVDLGALFLLVGSVLFETLADQEQWVFQNEKHRLLSQKGAVPDPSTDESIVRDYKRGFLTHGMFTFSRHPNFFFEQLVWWSYYLFAVAATGEVHWTLVGPVLLSLLFQGSTRFTEYITLKNYVIYSEYQKRVNILLPWLPTPEETAVGDKTE